MASARLSGTRAALVVLRSPHVRVQRWRPGRGVGFVLAASVNGACQFGAIRLLTARQRFTSTRQGLKASGWCGIELGPVELLLNAVKGFFSDLAPRAQALQCRALRGDRA